MDKRFYDESGLYPNMYEIAKAIQELNPHAEIRIADPAEFSQAEAIIFSSVPGDELVLPEGFYYNEKNGITNKHNTGAFTAAYDVHPLSDIREEQLLPKFDVPRNNGSKKL